MIKSIKIEGKGATVVLFHGFGASAEDLVGLSSLYKGKESPTWIFPEGPIEVPFAPGYSGKAWFHLNVEQLQQMPEDEIPNLFSKELEQIRAQVDEFLKSLDVPYDHLILGGFSQGAVLATEMALHAPLTPAGLLAFSGTLVNQPVWSRLAHAHAGMHYFQSHGKSDQILPFKGGEKLNELFEEAHFRGTFHTFAGGHEIPPPVQTEASQFLTNLLG